MVLLLVQRFEQSCALDARRPKKRVRAMDERIQALKFRFARSGQRARNRYPGMLESSVSTKMLPAGDSKSVSINK